MFSIEAFSEDQSCITLKAVSNNVTVELGGERLHVKRWGVLIGKFKLNR